MRLSLSPPLLLVALTTAITTASGCPADDDSSANDTEAGSESGSGSEASTGTDETSADTAMADATTTDPTGGDDTTTDPPDPTSDTEETADATDSGPDPVGVCIGYDEVGPLDLVFSAGGTPLPKDAACGGEPTPCDGDPVGVWDVATSCGYDQVPNPLEAECADSTFSVDAIENDGGLSLVDDGTFVWTVDRTLVSTLTFDPQACFGTSCEDVEASLMEDDPGVICTPDKDQCACVFAEDETTETEGVWDANKGIIALQVGDETEEFEYCAADGRLDLWQPIPVLTETDILCDDETECELELGDDHLGYLCAEPSER